MPAISIQSKVNLQFTPLVIRLHVIFIKIPDVFLNQINPSILHCMGRHMGYIEKKLTIFCYTYQAGSLSGANFWIVGSGSRR